jgi:hypothetical protein
MTECREQRCEACTASKWLYSVALCTWNLLQVQYDAGHAGMMVAARCRFSHAVTDRGKQPWVQVLMLRHCSHYVL